MYKRIQVRLFLFLTLPLIAILILALVHVRSILQEESLERVKSHLLEQVQHQAAEISMYLSKVEGIANTTAMLLSFNPNVTEDKVSRFLQAIVSENNIIYGAAVAYEPGTYPGKNLFAPYVYREGNELLYLDIAAEAYDYTEPQWQWWNGPKVTRTSLWTNPYYDEGAGDVFMVTYSTPFYHDEKFRGVTTIDIDITELHESLALEGLSSEDYAIITNTGHFAYHYKYELIGQSIFELAQKFKTPQASEFARLLTTGEGGIFEYTVAGKKILSFYAPVGHFGWSFAIRVSEQQAMHLSRMTGNSIYLWVLFLLLSAVTLTVWMSGALVLKPLQHIGRNLRQWTEYGKAPDTETNELDEYRRIDELVLSAYSDEQEKIKLLEQKRHDAEKLVMDKVSQLNRIEHRYRSLLDSEYLNRMVIDKEGCIISTNAMAHKTMQLENRLTDKASGGLNISEFISSRFAELFQSARQVMQQENEPQVINNFEFIINKKAVIAQIILLPSNSMRDNFIVTFIVSED